MVDEKPLTQDEMDDLQDLQDEAMEDQQEEQFDNQQSFNEEYGSPEPEEKQNPSAFLFRSAFDSPDTLRTTYLENDELGRPLFSIRFLLDMEDIAKFYIDEFAKEHGSPNRIADYFRQKIHNITDSGMSREGFTANLNVTKKIDLKYLAKRNI